MEIYHGIGLSGKREDASCADAMVLASLGDGQPIFIKLNRFAACIGEFHQVLLSQHAAF